MAREEIKSTCKRTIKCARKKGANAQKTQTLIRVPFQEFHRNMNAPDSALKLFLKYTPDALEHLFDKCIASYCESEQVQGKIFFDFFLFCPPPVEQGLKKERRADTGELTLTQILISHGKAYFLLHPLFETFIKVI